MTKWGRSAVSLGVCSSELETSEVETPGLSITVTVGMGSASVRFVGDMDWDASSITQYSTGIKKR